ncbi:Endoplasmic oxidoreductin [Globisporangium polare]
MLSLRRSLLAALALLLVAPPATTTASPSPSPAAAAATPAPSSKAQQQRHVLFPKEMYDFLQCQVCHTPELSGSVQDSGCDYETVDKAVSEHFHPLLQELSHLTFFRYFKVDLGKECPFWRDDDGMCASIDCAVCECPSHEIPKTWFQMDAGIVKDKASSIDKPTATTSSQTAVKVKKTADTLPEEPGKPCSKQTGEEDELSKVDRTNAVAGETFRGWQEKQSPEIWSNQGEPGDTMVYINLLENPERYTGYSGYQAERVWNSIYQENCFTPQRGQESTLDGMCFEERVYYRLISGLQASINTHIALRYKYGDSWGKNPSLFVNRVGKHKERLQNLYFTYLFVMRALGRYRHELLQYDYSTGNDEDDRRVEAILKQLVFEDKEQTACPSEKKSVLSGFNEQALFRVQRGQMSYDEFIDAKEQKRQLEVQFREKFLNVSRIMDCVTCEKCRLWGKIQTMGLGTAIKILLADDVQKLPRLNRNELIALINVATNLSRSVDGVSMFRHLELVNAIQQFALVSGAAVAGVIALILCLRKRNTRRQRINEMKKSE